MTDFRELAACRDVDPELFFPVGAPGFPAYDRQVARAKAVCRTCPVLVSCLFFALNAGIEYGVYGGADEFERATLRRALPARAPAA